MAYSLEAILSFNPSIAGPFIIIKYLWRGRSAQYNPGDKSIGMFSLNSAPIEIGIQILCIIIYPILTIRKESVNMRQTDDGNFVRIQSDPKLQAQLKPNHDVESS